MGIEGNKKSKDGILYLRNKEEKEERSETGQKETCSEGCKDMKGCMDDQVQSFEEDILHRIIGQSDKIADRSIPKSKSEGNAGLRLLRYPLDKPWGISYNVNEVFGKC